MFNLYAAPLLFAGLLPLVVACATAANGEQLHQAVKSYNENLRWKRFEAAATFLPPEDRAQFVEEYLLAEDDVQIDHIDIRALELFDDPRGPAAKAVVVCEGFRLPSTVVQRIVQVQVWRLLKNTNTWRLVQREPSCLGRLAGGRGG